VVLTKVTSSMNSEPLVKPLDAQSFEQLLAAAYRLQQQRRAPISLVAPPAAKSAMDEAGRLAAIAETHTVVQGSQLRLQETLQLVTDRAVNITGGSGAAIWLLRGENTVCQAACGFSVAGLGSTGPVEGSRLMDCLRDGLVFRCDDIQTDPRTRYDALPSTAKGSLIAVPILHEGQVQGALEVTFAKPRAFEEADVRTCQILGGLVSQTVAEAVGRARKEILESERATLLEALDRIQPHLSKLFNSPETAIPGQITSVQNPSLPPQSLIPAGTEGPTHGLARLGKYLMSQQGQAAANEVENAGNLKPARRDVQTALNFSVSPNRRESTLGGNFDADDLDSENPAGSTFLHDFEEQPSARHAAEYVEAEPADHANTDFENTGLENTDLANYDAPWPAANEESELVEESIPFESGAAEPAPVSKSDYLRAHWADVCLALSIIALVSSLSWALWPRSKPFVAADASASTTASPEATPQLTTFEQLLVSLGLAEAPPAPAAYTGAPGVKVWVDLHSALYYCPGAEPYGKTPKGKFVTQHDAQAEQFQPARGQPCD